MLNKVTRIHNLRSAFERVASSRGMAGVDGVGIGRFRRDLGLNLAILAGELAEGRYEPLPLLRFLAEKKDGTPRPLTVPCVRDRVAQAGVLNVIAPLFEAEFEDVSFAYRKGRSVKQAIRRIMDLHEKGYKYVTEADIDSYFDNISHELLLDRVSRLVGDKKILDLIKSWVKSEVYDGKQVYVNEKGVPQGTVISPMLANLFRDKFDETLIEQGFQLVRYSDDFVVLSKTMEEAREALELTETTLERLALWLDDEDTRVTEFDRGFKFLGVTFLGDSAFVPFDRPKKAKKILYMPPPFDLEKYLARKGRGK